MCGEQPKLAGVKTLTVVTDRAMQAIYIDGRFECGYGTVAAEDIELAASGEPVYVKAETLRGYKADEWPETLDEIKPFFAE